VRLQPPQLEPKLEDIVSSGKKIVVVTGHRRENYGEGFERICNALNVLSSVFSDTEFVYPVHLNPHVRATVMQKLRKLPNIHLIAPLPYKSFIRLLDNSYLILTDSGGIQEEGPALGKPILIMRDVTERPEGIQTGVCKLVGTEKSTIFSAVCELLTDSNAYERMAKLACPYGDGIAANRIASILSGDSYSSFVP
jgi:UDP-N-acetylglucosamine 2-epimerase